MAYVTPPSTCLRFSVALTASAASDMGATANPMPCAFFMADTPIGYQWQVAVNTTAGWLLISQGTYAGEMYDDGAIPGICTEINSVGIVAWIMRQATWFNLLVESFFTGKVPGSVPVPPSSDVTPQNFLTQVNGTLATMGARDTNGDGIPELLMA